MEAPLCPQIVIQKGDLPRDAVEQVFYVARALKQAGVENFDDFFTAAQGLRADEILTLIARWVTLVPGSGPRPAGEQPSCG